MFSRPSQLTLDGECRRLFSLDVRDPNATFAVMGTGWRNSKRQMLIWAAVKPSTMALPGLMTVSTLSHIVLLRDYDGNSGQYAGSRTG